MPDTQEYKVRKALQFELSTIPDEDIWQGLVMDGFVDQVEEFGQRGFSLLVKECRRRREWLRVAGDKADNQVRRHPIVDSRAQVVSWLLARQAQQLPRLRRFRLDFLGRRLLTGPEIGPWIAARARADGEPTQWLTIPLPSGHDVRQTNPVSADGENRNHVVPPLTADSLGHAGKRFQEMLYWVNVDNRHETIAVTFGGVLDTLRMLGSDLAPRYHWSPAQATNFILAGQVPYVPPVIAQLSGPRQGEPVTYQRSRIVLHVDPECPPAELVAAYQTARRKVQRGRRNRPLTAKTLSLLEFVFENENHTWQERMEAWNQRQGELAQHRYTQVRNFAKDYHRAMAKLARPAACSPLAPSDVPGDVPLFLPRRLNQGVT